MRVVSLPRRVTLAATLSLALAVGNVVAQQPSSTRPSPTPTSAAPSSQSLPAASASPTNTVYTTIYATTLTPGQQRPSGAPSQQSVFLTTSTVTSSLSPPSSTPVVPSPAPTPSPSAPAKLEEQTGLPLVTIIDPAFGILGALLIILGVCMAFVGHRSRWLVCLICGFYSFAFTTICIILRVGVARAVNDPTKTLKGLYLLASICSGCIGAGLYVIFRSGGLLMSSALGGFVLALFLQACKSDGIIQTIGIRYILYIAFSTIAFALACHSKLQPFVLIFSTALVGATSIILGIDCFTRANLKEFYIRNVGFDDLFVAKYPQEFAHGHWFLSTPSVIELGVIGGLTIMAVAFQSKMWSEFRTSLLEMRNSDEERHLQSKAKRATRRILASAQKDLRQWEERHGYLKTAGRGEEDLESNNKHNEEAEFEVLMSTSPTEKARSHTTQRSFSLPKQSIDSPLLDLPVGSSSSEPSLGASLGLSAPSALPPASTATPEHRKLMDEIATIRKSINELSAMPLTTTSTEETRTSMALPPRAHALSLGRNDVMDAKVAREKKEESLQQKASPWATSDRSRRRSHSISGMIAKPSPVDTNLFAWREEPTERAPAPKLELDIPGLSSSNMDFAVDKKRASVVSKKGQQVSSADFRISDAEGSITFPMPAAVQVERQKSMLTLMSGKGQDAAGRGGGGGGGGEKEGGDGIEDRRGRSSRRQQTMSYDGGNMVKSPTTRPAFDRSQSVQKEIADRKSKLNTSLSINELQARHNSQLKSLQQPTSARMEEVARLEEAQHEWEERKRKEKLRWEEKERKRSASGSRTLSTPLTSTPQSPSQQQFLAKIEAVPEQDGVSRAKEWRRSLQMASEKEANDGGRKRRSNQSQGHSRMEANVGGGAGGGEQSARQPKSSSRPI